MGTPSVSVSPGRERLRSELTVLDESPSDADHPPLPIAETAGYDPNYDPNNLSAFVVLSGDEKAARLFKALESRLVTRLYRGTARTRIHAVSKPT
jgi:hypothetical protein